MVLSKVAQEGMKIEIGRLYINKTVKYLVPSLGFYGPTLKTKLNMVNKLAFGIHDNLIEGTHLAGQRNIFILLDRLVRPELYENFMSWIKHQDYYVADYPYDDVQEAYSRKHMLIISYPEKLGDVYDKFLLGKYSKMYSKEEIELYFQEEGKAMAKHVLCRTAFAKNSFTFAVRDRFGTDLEEQDFLIDHWEYDFPPNAEEEFFNN